MRRTSATRTAGDEGRREAVHEQLRGGLLSLCLLNEAHHAVERTIPDRVLVGDLQSALAVHAPGVRPAPPAAFSTGTDSPVMGA